MHLGCRMLLPVFAWLHVGALRQASKSKKFLTPTGGLLSANATECYTQGAALAAHAMSARKARSNLTAPEHPGAVKAWNSESIVVPQSGFQGFVDSHSSG